MSEQSLARVELTDEMLGSIETERFFIQNRLDYLCQTYLNFKDWDICHDDLLDWLQESKKDKKLILMPRGHLKSSVLTVGLSIQHLLENPDVKILLASAVWDNARSFLSEIKEYLSTKSRLPRVYGRFESNVWNQDAIRIRQRKGAGKTDTIQTAGIDKALTGQHYDIIIADDLVNRQTISTEEQRMKVKKFYSDLQDLLEPNGTMYLIGTRWHDGDLYGMILKNQAEKFDIYKQGATKDGTMEGEVIFPKKFSNAKLQELREGKNTDEAMGDYEFFCQYFNEPINTDSQHFKPPVRFWTELGDNATHTITVDLAISEKTSADYSVVMDCALTRANQLCVVEYWRKRAEPSEVLERIFEYVLKYRCKRVGIEGVAYQRAMVNLVLDEQRKRNIFFEVIPILHSKDKFSRIIALQPRWQTGNLLVKQGMVELEEELARFPVSEHDDVADALAMQLSVIQPMGLLRPKVFIPSEYRSSSLY